MRHMYSNLEKDLNLTANRVEKGEILHQIESYKRSQIVLYLQKIDKEQSSLRPMITK